MNNFVYPIFALIIASFLSIIDGTPASFCVILLLVILGLLECKETKHSAKSYEMKLLGIVTLIYTVSAFVVSRNYLGNHFFLVSDALQYTQWINLLRAEDDYCSIVLDNYLGLLDKNSLHEVFVRLVCIFGNNYLGGTTVFYLTLTHTFFGVLAILAIYRTLLYYYDSRESYKYALVFALCSQFFFYSNVIIRDIVIAFCFARGIEIVLDEFKYRKLIPLCVYCIIAMGVRLYSGLFMFSFVIIYFAKKIEKTRLKRM